MKETVQPHLTLREYFDPIELPDSFSLEVGDNPQLDQFIKRLATQPLIPSIARIRSEEHIGRAHDAARKFGWKFDESFLSEGGQAYQRFTDGNWKDDVWYDSYGDQPVAYYCARTDSVTGLRLITMHYEGGILHAMQEYDVDSMGYGDDSRVVEYTINYGHNGTYINQIFVEKSEDSLSSRSGCRYTRAWYDLSPEGEILEARVDGHRYRRGK